MLIKIDCSWSPFFRQQMQEYAKMSQDSCVLWHFQFASTENWKCLTKLFIYICIGKMTNYVFFLLEPPLKNKCKWAAVCIISMPSINVSWHSFLFFCHRFLFAVILCKNSSIKKQLFHHARYFDHYLALIINTILGTKAIYNPTFSNVYLTHVHTYNKSIWSVTYSHYF